MKEHGHENSKAQTDGISDDSCMAIEELVEKYEVESRFRKYSGTWAKAVTVIAVSMSLFHLYTAGFGSLMFIKQRAVHLAFLLILAFLLYPATAKSPKERPSTLDLCLAVLAAMAALYNVFYFDALNLRGGIANFRDYFWGVICMLLVLEAGRRALGKELPILAIVFLLYALFGDRIPGVFGHTGFTAKRIIYHMFLSSEGLFGITLGVSATYIFLFILFGAVLGETGMARFINDFSTAIAGHAPGGPAKIATIASGLLGTINGSAVANVATTGSFTIPLMRSIGYAPYFAGAVEAVASTGGQIMPPVMGAAAFVMAEFLGESYTRIMIGAAIPALLYYLACYMMVHLEASRTGLKGLPREQLPNLKEVVKARGHLVIPVVAIVYLLLQGRPPLFAGFWGIIVALITAQLRASTRLSLPSLIKALEMGARGAVSVGLACATVGFIVGVTGLSGFGLVLGDNIVSLAHGNVAATLALTMIAALVLGMGLPTTACYIVAATVAAPALIKIGVLPLAAHMFVFYFACLSNLTPPVALAAYTGAGIAGASPGKTGWTAVRLGIAGFIVPFVFVYSPVLLFEAPNIGVLVLAAATACIGVVALAVAAEGFLFEKVSLLERGLLFAGALTLIVPGLATDLIGLVLVGAGIARQVMNIRRRRIQTVEG